jgi:predicted transcriptional regulator
MPKNPRKLTAPTGQKRGGVLLAQKLGQRKLSINGAGKLLGAKEGMVSRWIRGERTPGARWSAEIEKVFGVRARTWAEPVIESAISSEAA